MPPDRLLATVLAAYQTPQESEQTDRILSTTTSLLTRLSNPLNITLLTSQLLVAPAIWSDISDLRACLRIVSVFNTAAITIYQHQIEVQTNTKPRQGGWITCDDWASAVLKGADEKSTRWQHLLVIGGVLLGMEGNGRNGLSRGLRSTVEAALVTATKLALNSPARDGILGGEAIVLVLNHTFHLISISRRRELNYDVLAPIILQSMIRTEGYQEGLFLGAIDGDVKHDTENKLEWTAKSSSFLQIQNLASKPLVSSMGPLAKLMAHALRNLSDSRIIIPVLDDLGTFTSMLTRKWYQCKLSGVDPSEENVYLSQDTLRTTFPVLWQVLKSAMFSTTVILGAAVGRTLVDPLLSSDAFAPAVASKTLFILRNIHFISAKLGSSSFSAYTFVSLTSIDILTHFPTQAREFLEQTRPVQCGRIPAHPLDRNLDLFYLNTSEHFPLVLTPKDNEGLIISAALPYVDPKADGRLLEIFEAAHSAMLAVLAAPRNTGLTPRLIPLYTEALFSAFPLSLSSRQFRFAFKTLLQITTPPAPLSASQPFLPDTLLELLHHRALNAPASPLPPALVVPGDNASRPKDTQAPLSEKTVLVLTLLDALPFLPFSTLEEWLPIAADLLNSIKDTEMREGCTARFWEVLENGEMDIERAAVAVGWWTSRGGREKVLYGPNSHLEPGGPFMSGGLPARDGSRL